jgi:dTDP-4-dehydrorhamnose reductase
LPAAEHVALVAAETKFDACASEPERTHRINVEAPVILARRALSQGSRVLFFSSIAVHDGTVDRPDEGAAPTPNSVYGRQKLEAEERLAALGGDIAVLRPSKVVTPDFRLFTNWRDLLLHNQIITPFEDMLVAPVSLEIVVSVAASLLCRPTSTGIFQLSAYDQVSYAEIASWLAEALGVGLDLVKPAKARDAKGAMWLPDHARLGCARLVRELGIELPGARGALDYFLAGEAPYV